MNQTRTFLRFLAWGSALGVACLSIAQQTQSPARSDRELIDSLANARRAGCGTSAGTAAPLQPVPALSDAAARIAKGESPMQAARSAGYRATRIYHATFRGYDSAAAVARSMTQRYCAPLANPELTGVGWHREGNAWWVVLATRFAPPEPGDAGAVATRVLALTNEARTQRRQCGERWFDPAGPLRYNAALERAARTHAEDMARNSFLDHAGRNGSSAGDRASEAGYAWRSIGENIAAGQATPEQAVRDWLRSPGHCSAIMNAAFMEMGVAYAVNAESEAGIYWAQEFGRPR